MKKATICVDIMVPDDYSHDDCLDHFVHWLSDSHYYNLEAWAGALTPGVHFVNEEWKTATINAYKQNIREIREAIRSVRVLYVD